MPKYSAVLHKDPAAMTNRELHDEIQATKDAIRALDPNFRRPVVQEESKSHANLLGWPNKNYKHGHGR